MKIIRFIFWIILFLWLSGSPLALAQPSNSSGPGNEAFKSLLEELKKSIEDADKRMVAHPRFLDELRALVERYRTRLREVFFYEDFSDGDFTKNPKWTVKSGQFRIIPTKRLWSRVSIEPPPRPSSAREQEPFELLLKGLIRTKEKERQKQGSVPKQKDASIQAQARISPAFEIDLTFLSEATWGTMEVVLMGGDPPAPRYRLIYQASPSPERPIEIIRVRDSRQYTIESATRFPSLDDGSPHRLQWIRNAQGEMKVLVDGQEIITTVEIFYQDEFGGLGLVNRGGTYEWGPIKVLQAPKAPQP